jgi:hypothetical protein
MIPVPAATSKEKQAKNQKKNHIFSITRHQKNLKTIGAYTESTYLTFRTFKKSIRLMTQSL